MIAGILILAFAGYTAVDPEAKAQQNSSVMEVEREISKPATKNAPRVAIMQIPALGGDWKKAIREGVGDDSLAKGIGHYPSTVYAGQEGTAGYAGHRSGHGNPLLDIENVKIGDKITVRDASGDYTYVVKEAVIVSPKATWVLNNRPGKWLVLTTCWPKWGNEKRYVLFAQMS